MKTKHLFNFAALAFCVLFAYGAANAQVVEKVKEGAEKAASATGNAVEKVADKTADAAKATYKGGKKVGNRTVELVDNVVDKSVDGGRWVVESTWDGSKWVSKRVWVASKKAAEGTKDFVVGDKDKKP